MCERREGGEREGEGEREKERYCRLETDVQPIYADKNSLLACFIINR